MNDFLQVMVVLWLKEFYGPNLPKFEHLVGTRCKNVEKFGIHQLIVETLRGNKEL